jgi:hypothetical protein
MYEVAYTKKLNFNKALTLLDERGIAHEKTEQKIIFFPKTAEPDLSAAAGHDRFGIDSIFAGLGPDAAGNGSFQDLLAQVETVMKGMSPEQLRQVEELYRNMDDGQKADLMQKARDSGLLK